MRPFPLACPLMLMVTPIVTLLPLAVVARQDESAGSPTRVDLSLRVPVGTPLLVEQVLRTALDIEIGPDGEALESAVKSRIENHFIDTYSVLDEEREEATRFFLRTWDEEDGEVQDPAWSGLEVFYELDDEGTFVHTGESRHLPPKDYDRLLELAPSLWVWVRFPDELGLGDTFELDLSPIATLVFGDGNVYETAAAYLTFEQFDEVERQATFRGTASFRARPVDEELQGTVSGEGRVAIVTDLAEGRIHHFDFTGRAELEATVHGVPARGGGELAAVIETRIPEDAERLRGRKPEFRTATRASPHGVSIDVPSYWAEAPAAESSYMLVRTLDTDLGEAVITLQPTEPTPAGFEFVEAMTAQFHAQFQDVKDRRVSSRLGKGISFTFDQEVEGEVVRFRIDYYPAGTRWTMLRLHGVPAAFENALKDFEKARRTLREQG